MLQAKNQQRRITLVAGFILVVISVLVGVAVFVVMKRHAENLLDRSLQSTLQTQVKLIHAEIRTGYARTTIAASRPLFIALVQRLNSNTDDVNTRSSLYEVTQSLLPTGLTGIAVFDKDGREVARAGTFTQKSVMTVSLNIPERVQLLWDEGLILHATAELNLSGQLVGKIITQTALPSSTSALSEARNLGDTGEMRLCAAVGSDIQCFPTTLNPKVFSTPRVGASGELLPIAYAVDGKTGFIRAADYREQDVNAAFAPVGHTRLGTVLKIDSAELYASVWQQLRFVIPIILGMLMMALLSLRWLLSPLVAQIVRSQEQIAGLNAELEQRVEQRTSQLEASNRDLQEFAYSVAHDLRQPFISIGGFTGLLEAKVDDEIARHYLDRIKTEGVPNFV